MKLYFSISLLLFSFLWLLSACTNDEVPKKGDSVVFPLNTEWTGVMHQTSEEYYEPCYLRINNDSTIKMYGLFYYYNVVDNSVLHRDSVSGTVKSIDTADGKITVVFRISGYSGISGDQTLVITDKRNLRCNGTSSPFALFLQEFLNKQVSIEGKWSGPALHGQYEGRFAYPDLLDIVFNGNGTTTYWRKGVLVHYGVPQTGDYYLIKAPYRKIGPMVWMDGYNEDYQKLIPYLGILTGQGDTLLVTTRNFVEGRVPSKINGLYQEGPYGISGYTPYITRTE